MIQNRDGELWCPHEPSELGAVIDPLLREAGSYGWPTTGSEAFYGLSGLALAHEWVLARLCNVRTSLKNRQNRKSEEVEEKPTAEQLENWLARSDETKRANERMLEYIRFSV